jgi:AcrR family transcriptional regulator
VVSDEARIDPRVARTREQVLDSARLLIAEHGVDALTIEGVAARAGVSRMTIYRHWGSALGLVDDAFDSSSAAADPIPAAPSGSLRADLIEIYTGLAGRLADPERGALLAAFLAAAERDPVSRRSYRQFVTKQRHYVRAVLKDAVDRGELSDDTDLELAVDLLAAPPFYRRLVSGDPINPPGYIERLVDTVLAGLGHSPSGLQAAKRDRR